MILHYNFFRSKTLFFPSGKTGTNILRKVEVPIIDNEECLRWHHHKGIDVKLYSEMFCAGHPQGQMDACLVSSGQ